MRKLLSALLFILCLCSGALAEAALSLEAMPEENQRKFLRNVSLVAWQEDFSGRAIECYDVSDTGMVALGFTRPGHGRYVAVLDGGGMFRYGYVFTCRGEFLLDWDHEGLGIIWVRSNVRAVFDEEGECLSIAEYGTDSASGRYLNRLRQPARRVGEVTWILRSDSPLALNYARLVRTDADGNEMVLHEASGTAGASVIVVCAVAVFVTGCIIIAHKRRVERIDNPLNS